MLDLGPVGVKTTGLVGALSSRTWSRVFGYLARGELSMADQIEFEDHETHVCPCCGSTVVSLTRFVRREGREFAVYWIDFVKGHQPAEAVAMVGLGDWDEDATPSEARVAFAFKIRSGPEGIATSIVDPKDSPWADQTPLGRNLSRAEALAHPWLPEVYALSDQMVRRDEVLREHLMSSSGL